jgi:hypothetical protein
MADPNRRNAGPKQAASRTARNAGRSDQRSSSGQDASRRPSADYRGRAWVMCAGHQGATPKRPLPEGAVLGSPRPRRAGTPGPHRPGVTQDGRRRPDKQRGRPPRRAQSADGRSDKRYGPSSTLFLWKAEPRTLLAYHGRSERRTTSTSALAYQPKRSKVARELALRPVPCRQARMPPMAPRRREARSLDDGSDCGAGPAATKGLPRDAGRARWLCVRRQRRRSCR